MFFVFFLVLTKATLMHLSPPDEDENALAGEIPLPAQLVKHNHKLILKS
jgi:hypothetical protein